jgi:subtilisin family serine protease
MRVRTALFVGALLVALFALPASGALSAESTQTYIVQMLEQPAVAYDGGVAGLAATKPAKGQKIDPDAANVQSYVGYLKAKHDEAISKVGGGAKFYDYAITYNGFAAKLTETQSEALKGLKNVVSVTSDELQTMDTSSTPAFLGLTAAGGLWQQLGGKADGSAGGKDSAGPGEGIIIGDVDSGIWPESQSVSDRDLSGKLVYQNIPHKNFKCMNGEQFNNSMCNEKLIGATYFNAAWGGNADLEAARPWEFMSPRDYNGHGTHTASTAGGNNGVQATGPAAVFGKVSGMAPRARIAAYKALWSTQDGSTASGFTSDLVAAIDQAVSDGVDVINYSISGTTTNFLDPAEVAFLFAADAGVFVSASAGNSGPTTGTVAHPSPWITTVAAGTHNRDGQGSVTLGNGTTYNGASVASPVGPAPLVDSTAVGLPGANATALALCFTAFDNGGAPVLDPAKVAGKIVLCDRGVNARVNKSLAVQQAGGVGMILVNTSANSINADLHFVPTVHLQDTARAAVKAYAATAGATARINQSTVVFNAAAPFTAAFSSRGPLTAGGGDLLKPDIIAPGQDVLAAVAKTPAQGNLDFNVLSGTSMSAPHVTGLAALLMDKYPSWSPMAIKSALMTSGSDVLDGPNTNPLVIFRQGAGHVRPNLAANPGLVFDSGFNDWLAFLCGTTTGVGASTCNALKAAGFSLDPSDFNSASIAIGDLAGVQTVTRKVTNVGGSPATYTPAVTGMTGITTNVSPSSLTLGAGQTGTFTVSFTRTTATLNAYTGGQLTWSDGTHNVRIPLVVRPVAIAAPLEVTGSNAGISYSVKTGYIGTVNFAARGLVAGTATAATVNQDPDQTFNPADATGTYKQDIVVPAGLSLFRVGIDEGFITPSGTDLDVFVFRGGSQVGSAADGDSNEMVTFTNPVAGTYTVYVHGFSTNGPSANFTLFDWQLPPASAGNMNVPAPAAATIGGSVPVNLTFGAGVTAGTWWLGQVIYNDGSSNIGSTIVNVK